MNEDKEELINYWKKDGIVRSRRILKAFGEVDRRDFVPDYLRRFAYLDRPLPIGENQTISQPTTIAIMIDALEPKMGEKILEVGTGSGYQTAILSKLVGKKGKVVSIERLKSLYRKAKKNLSSFGNIELVLGDGSKGYDKEAPFDKIIVSAASPSVPKPLVRQLKNGGILVIPVGEFIQTMFKIIKTDRGLKKEDLGEFRFVNLVGQYGFTSSSS